MWDWFIEIYNKSWFEAVFYFAPMMANAMIYPIEIIKRINQDKETVADFLKKKAAGQSNGYYGYNFITVGDLVKYVFWTVTPLVNALAFFFDSSWILWNFMTTKLGFLFNVKLVKPPEGLNK